MISQQSASEQLGPRRAGQGRKRLIFPTRLRNDFVRAVVGAAGKTLIHLSANLPKNGQN